MEKVSDVARRVLARLTKDGKEIISPVSLEPPVSYRRQPTLESRIRDAIRSELFNNSMAAQGIETAEEADDFDIPDDPVDPSTPYEAYFDPLPVAEIPNSDDVVPAEPARAQPVQADPDADSSA